MKAKKKNGLVKEKTGIFDPMAVTWTEKYNRQITKVWDSIPEHAGKVLASVAVFILGISINGDWVNLWVHVGKQFGYYNRSTNSISLSDLSLESLKLNNLWSFWWPSVAVSYSLYILVGGFLHWYYYVRRRHISEEWKCQPNKWLTPELERQEIAWGCTTLFFNASVSAIMSCYIANGGWSTVYYDITEYGFLWFFLQFPLIFILQDYTTYWLHRLYHWPFLYKNFHKLHHKYKQPTAWSVTAIHPVESVQIQLTLSIPLFTLPIHWLPFYACVFYAYYHGIIDHSGINFKSFWWQPWQPDAIFHDNHHQYFHVNFGFNIGIWDKLHGTYRRKDRIYTEDTFYGVGKTFEKASEEELKADIEERNVENPLAYREKMPFKLSQKEVQQIHKNK